MLPPPTSTMSSSAETDGEAHLRLDDGQAWSLFGESNPNLYRNTRAAESLYGNCFNISNNFTVQQINLTMLDAANLSCNTAIPPVPPLPKEMTFNDNNLMSVISYSVLFIIAALGNLTVFVTLFRNRHRKSRVNLFIMHLSIADLIVTFIMLPLEIVWQSTVAWKAGDVACRILMFFRAFGFYLSSFILVTISLDRYFVILHPLSLMDADKRGKIMIVLAWLFSIVASIPQSVIFHVEYHPVYTWFGQCVTFNFFPTPAHELAYNLFNIIAVYVLPLAVIIVAYSIILREMTKKTRESREAVMEQTGKTRGKDGGLRRSGMGKLERARIRTLKMTVMIVLVFILCWTPYFVISAWWWFDKESAEKVNPKVQRGLFLFAVSNSCMDPIVYGMFTINFKGEFRRCCCYFRPTEFRDDMNSHTGLIRHNTLLKSHSSARDYHYAASVQNGAARCKRQVVFDPVPMVTAPDRQQSTSRVTLERQNTPPYIAEGKGLKGYNDDAVMMMMI